MRRSLVLDVLALALLALLLATAAPTAVRRTAIRVRYALHFAREDPAATRARCFGADYVSGVDAIRRRIRQDEPYLLVEGGDPRAGGALWVRWDLSPRPAIYGGRLGDLADRARPLGSLPANLRYAVLSRGPERAPALFPLSHLLRGIERSDGR